jgi:hypothetical protein
MPPILANKGITLTNIDEYRLLVSTVLQLSPLKTIPMLALRHKSNVFVLPLVI